MKKTICALLVILFLTGCGTKSTPNSVNTKKSDLTIGSETIIDFYDILLEIGISSQKVKNIAKIEDWAYGPRYTFETHGSTATVYCNTDYEIETIRFGTDLELYKKGYESWKIDNFIVSPDMRTKLITYTEELVRSRLKYPDEADFPLMDWTVTRQFNKYAVKSYVKAQNALGLKPEVPFTVGLLVDGDQAKVIYFELDGRVSVNEWNKYPLPERKRLAATPNESGMIHIADGQYKKVVELAGQEYVWYMVPSGKYRAVCNSDRCMVYLEKNDVSNGKINRIATYSCNKGEYVVITVSEDQHLSCSANTDITLENVEN